MKTWRVRKGQESRVKMRHPWVFAGDLLDSPKGISNGEEIELQDFNGNFLARGYGNAVSQIAFRSMSYVIKEEFSMSSEKLTDRLFRAWEFRNKLGFKKSFRLCFSEADQMPGLILDRYVFSKGEITYQVYSFQILTAGMDRAFLQQNKWQEIFHSLTKQSLKSQFSEIDWDHTIVLLRNDVSIRKLEGLTVEEPRILKSVGEENLSAIKIQVQRVLDQNKIVEFNVNLPAGQKTGFFLDQSFNIQLVLEALSKQKDSLKNKVVKILDLCCYMGQWSVQIAAQLADWGIESEIHLVDVSELALEMARQNVAQYTSKVYAYKKDVLSLDEIVELRDLKFEIVISDPPAFVKNKKDLHQGLHAYAKLNTYAFKLASSGALVASCTCSGAVSLDDFKSSLQKAVLKSGAAARCIAFGGQGWDHPHTLNFQEGYYLKMALHQL